MPGLLTIKTARAIDRKAREKFGISTLVLMENAGSAVAREIVKSCKGKKKIAIFCGKGNNGGDGLVAARHLLAQGINPDIFLAGKLLEVRNEAKTNLEVLLNLKRKVIEVNEINVDKINIAKYGLIIDALLGVGLTGQVRASYSELIRLINSSKAYIVSVDIPSGLDATTGEILGCCVKADKTITFIAKKRGMVIGDGPKYCGKIIVVNLGIPI